MIFKKKISLSVLNYALVLIFSKGLTLLCTYFLALYTNNEVFGYISIFQASFLVALTIFGFNLQSAFLRFYYDFGLKKVIEYTKKIFFFMFIFCAISSISIFLFLKDIKYYEFFSLLPLIGFFSSLGVIFSILARMKNKFTIYLFIELARPVTLIILILVFVVNKFDLVFCYFLSLFLSTLFILIFCFFNFYKFILNDNDLAYEENNLLSTKKIVQYTFPLYLVQIVSLINNVSDKFILSYYLDVFSVGIYSKAYVIGSTFGLLFDSLSLLWAPYVMKNKKNILYRYRSIILKLNILIFIVSILFLIFGFFVYFNKLNIFSFGYDFVSIFLIVLAAFISRGGYMICTPILNSYDRTKIVFKISIIGMLVAFVFNVVFIPIIGLIAAAISTFIGYFMFSFLALCYILRIRV